MDTKKPGRPVGSRSQFSFSVVETAKARDRASQESLGRELEYITQAPASAGKKLLKTYYSGGRITPRQAITAMCCRCLGHYRDGREDCETLLCPLYPYMPYRRQ
jgi:hypothetical protein